MKPYLLKIGTFELRIYSLMYILAFLSAIYMASKDEVAKKRGIKNKKIIEDFAFFVFICGLIGARTYYVILRLDSYLVDPISILKIWEGGLAIHGGIIGGFLGALIFSIKNNINLWVLTDMAVGPLLFGQFLGRFGNLANGEVHGVPTFTPIDVILKGNFPQWWESYENMSLIEQSKFNELVPWGLVFPSNTSAGLEFPGYSLHPAMLYEAFLNFIGFIILWFIIRKKEFNRGILTMYYLIFYGIIRIVVSTFRAEDLMIKIGNSLVRAPYVISGIMILIGVIGIFYFKRVKK